jgi:hypothetical protein
MASLDFTSLTGGCCYGAAIDNVRVSGPEPVSVPDPGSTLLLLGMALAGLTAWRKRLQ